VAKKKNQSWRKRAAPSFKSHHCAAVKGTIARREEKTSEQGGVAPAKGERSMQGFLFWEKRRGRRGDGEKRGRSKGGKGVAEK